MQSSTHLGKIYCFSQGGDILVNGFSAPLSQGRAGNWIHKIFSLKVSNHLRAGSVFLQYKIPHPESLLGCTS